MDIYKIIEEELKEKSPNHWDIFLERINKIYNKQFKGSDKPLWEVRKRLIIAFPYHSE